MGSVAKEVGRVWDSATDEVGRNWDKWGKDALFNAGTGGLYSVGKEMIPEMPDIPTPETEAPGAGVQTDQSAMQTDSLSNERRRRASHYTMSNTNRTGLAQMRSGSLKSTLG